MSEIQIPEKSTDEIAKLYSISLDSVTVIDTIAAKSSINDEDKEEITRNVEHLETMKAEVKPDGTSSIWTTEDFTDIDAAITKGKDLLA